jgi:hypothetical protein
MTKPRPYSSLDWSIQPPYLHEPYRSTIKRAPHHPLIPLPQTLSELTGPVYATMQSGPWTMTSRKMLSRMARRSASGSS